MSKPPTRKSTAKLCSTVFEAKVNNTSLFNGSVFMHLHLSPLRDVGMWMPLSPKWISINDGATPSHHPFYCRIVPDKPTSKLLGDPPLMETPNRPMRRAWPSKSTSWHESLCCRYSCYLSVTETIAEIHRFGKCRAYAISTYINHKRQ